MLKFPVSQLYDKPERPKLLPGRKSIIQIAERPILQQPKNITQFQYPITQSHKQCQSVTQFVEQ